MADLIDKLRATIRHSRQQAREILADPLTAVLDTETTGLDGAFICDLAVISKGRTIFNTLVNPGVPIPAGASAIHGIFDDDVRDAPTFQDLWPKLRSTLKRNRIVIYNAPYDLRVLGNETERLGVELPRVNCDDALALYQAWYFGGIGRSGRGQTKLTTPHCDSPACLEAANKHVSSGAHRAFADCRATVERLRMIAHTNWLDDHYREATSVRHV